MHFGNTPSHPQAGYPVLAEQQGQTVLTLSCSYAGVKRKNLLDYLLEKASQLAQHPLQPPQTNTLIRAPFILIPESHMQHDL